MHPQVLPLSTLAVPERLGLVNSSLQKVPGRFLIFNGKAVTQCQAFLQIAAGPAPFPTAHPIQLSGITLPQVLPLLMPEVLEHLGLAGNRRGRR
jgi:hypothetical protein